MARRLNWGLIGGGEGSQIGAAHRIAAALDRKFRLVAGALDVDPERGREFAARCGIDAARAYGDWREMIERERALAPDAGRLDLVTVATPNVTHYAIAKAFLEAGFDVLCEKPLTTTVEDGAALVAAAKARRRVLAVNYGYSGYPLIRQARAMALSGELGRIRVVVAEFAHGFHASAADAGNPRVRWRYDPRQMGASSVLADVGCHALHLACYAIGQEVRSVAADFASCVAGRELEDDAMLALRFSGGAVGRLWASAVAAGQMHGLTLRVFGERGGLRWAQEQPNQLYWTPSGEPTRILERGAEGLSPEAARASRIVVGHVEGMLGAFANVYADLAEALAARRENRRPDPPGPAYPTGAEGAHSVAVVHAAARSAAAGGRWVEV